MSINPRIGFVGFGEAGFHLAAGLRKAGIEQITAFDIDSGEAIRQRAAETGTPLVGSNAELTALSDIILSTVTSDQALIAAQQTAPGLGPRHLYADLNS